MGRHRGQLSRDAVGAKASPNDLVTEADTRIESLVRGYLGYVRPGDRVVGEEGAASELPDFDEFPGLAGLHEKLAEVQGTSQGLPEELEWHVDPIDGTVNFVRTIEHHCFSIGACIPGAEHPALAQWEVGLVDSPVLGSAWFAVRGEGAHMVKAEGAVGAVRLTGTPAGRRGAVVATGFGYAPELRRIQLEALPKVMAEFDDLRRMGSAAIDLCQAAEGRVNAYYERGLGVYDWAAGALIAREAGLHVRIPTERNGLMIAADTPERLRHLEASA